MVSTTKIPIIQFPNLIKHFWTCLGLNSICLALLFFLLVSTAVHVYALIDLSLNLPACSSAPHLIY